MTKENIKTLFSIIKIKIELLIYVPYRCRYCELLGLCRDRKNHWRCGKRGCLILWQDERNKLTKKEFKKLVQTMRYRCEQKRKR